MKRQNGAALVVAIFLIVVLALLGAVAVRLSAVQSHTVSLSLLGSRAIQAARTGVEWAAYQAQTAGTCLNSTTTLGEAGLNGFTITTSCSVSTHTEGNKTVQIYHLWSQASYGSFGQPDYVSRRISSSLSRTL